MATKASELFSTNSYKHRCEKHLAFGEFPFEVLTDFLTCLGNKNTDNLHNLSVYSGYFKERKVIEFVFFICEEFKLDPLVAYHAVEILEKFMVKHLEGLLSSQKYQTSQGATCPDKDDFEDLVFKKLNKKLFMFILSSVQISSKLALHSSVVDINAALRLLQSMGHHCSKDKLLKSELLVLKTLDFNINVPNPLCYIETLLEALGHNDSSVPVAYLHHLCRYVLQFIYLQRVPVYHSLLIVATECPNPPPEHRAQFLSVTEDFMLLGVAVIAASAFIGNISPWEQVVAELNVITGISVQSITDFAHVILMHITKQQSQLHSQRNLSVCDI